MRKADLHLHTHASSDASFDPEEVFSIAKARGLTALTFSDHDSFASNAAGQRLADIYDVAFLPGVEITSSWGGKPAHVLGFFPMVRCRHWKIFWPIIFGRCENSSPWRCYNICRGKARQ